MHSTLTHRSSPSIGNVSFSNPDPHPSTQPRSLKTSLGFILSPPGNNTGSNTIPLPPIRSFSISSHYSMPSPASSTSSDPALHSTISGSRKRSRLEKLPRNLIAHIAFLLVIDDQTDSPGRPKPRKHPNALFPLFLSCRTIYDAISFDNNPQLYNTLFRHTFDTSALDRRYRWMQKHLASQAGRGRKIFDLFSDPRSWAIDYKTRWEQASRMRLVVKKGDYEGVCTRDQLTADLWNVWFLLTENDGQNVPFLARECDFQRWIVVYYREDMLRDSLVPGYPKDTGDKALGIWCSLMSGTDVSAETTPAEVDEKIFVMRPYVFACAKYDITYAPWHHRRLPLCEPGCTDHGTDITLRSKAIPYKRFGYTWRRAPPHFILGIYLAFLRLVERQPGRMGLKPGSSTFATPPDSAPIPGLFSITRLLPSIYHDREWQRNSVCQDPHTSPGLPPLTFRGEIEGFWRCKFLFYDFDMYRQILAGNIRGVYTGTFAEQATEMQLKETVIKVKKEDVGGKGPLLCAGFDIDGEGHDPEEEREKIQQGYGHELCLDEDEPDEPGWTKEILISGIARSSWGYCDVRGRIRAWDGLVILACSYVNNHILGRWLWRGYLHTGGHLIGRWRDTFTPEHLRGYEGAFGMIRAGDIYYPPQYPMKMEESPGLHHTHQPGHPEGPTFPNTTLIGQSNDNLNGHLNGETPMRVSDPSVGSAVPREISQGSGPRRASQEGPSRSDRLPLPRPRVEGSEDVFADRDRSSLVQPLEEPLSPKSTRPVPDSRRQSEA